MADREHSINSRKSKLLVVLLSFLLPGSGHIYAGQYYRGLLLLAGLLLDVTAIVSLANSGGGRHLLLIVYLIILLPVLYFISVYDSLQSLEREDGRPESARALHGLLLILAGMLQFVILKPPPALLPWMNELAELSVGPLVMAAAAAIFIRSRKGMLTMFKLGRITAAVLILSVGALLLWDQAQGRNDIALIGQWWPVLFILLGIEIIIYSAVLRKGNKRLKFDAAGCLIAVLITAAAYSVTQYADFPARWLDQFNVDLNGLVDYGEEKGYRYDKPVTKLPLDEALTSIRINNLNGRVTVRAADVKDIELRTTVWIDTENSAEAEAAAEQSVVKVTPGPEMLLEAKGESYGSGGDRKPRMNIDVLVPVSLSDQWPANTVESPEQRSVKLKIEVSNGAIQVSNLTLLAGLEIKSGSGPVAVDHIIGPVSVKGTSGNIQMESIAGESSLETKNGSIAAASVNGRLYASTWNGSLDLKEITDDIDAETKNGKISINGAAAAVKADTLNGSIEVSSDTVGGNWDLDSSIGEIKVLIPNSGDYSLYGSVTFGNIQTGPPFEINRKTVRGTIGDGTYRIQINATNSISIKQPEL